MNNEITILGSGTSTGIPMLGCHCKTCKSTNIKNYRLRTSVHIKTESDVHFVIDTGPDFRTQMLTNKLERVDFAFITHDHADHTHGIDDLRPLCFGPPPKEIPIYTYGQCYEELKQKYPYIFQTEKVFSKDRPPLGGGIPKLKLIKINDTLKQTIEGEEFEFLLLNHGYTKTLGIIHKKMAYIIDCNEITDDQIETLKNKELDLLIIDCVSNNDDHKTHLSRNKAFHYIERISPKRAGLIHMNHALEHEELEESAKKRFDFPVFATFDTQHLKY
jgi:phosphoribosyl 1,2-cyclic phosphate phosphodiesterase